MSNESSDFGSVSTVSRSTRIAEWVSRRSFMQKIGAGGLVAASAVFGDPSAAGAHYYHYGCCHLFFVPSSYSACRSTCNYTWNCQMSYTSGCSCCEKDTGCNGDYNASAYHCDHT